MGSMPCNHGGDMFICMSHTAMCSMPSTPLPNPKSLDFLTWLWSHKTSNRIRLPPNGFLNMFHLSYRKNLLLPTSRGVFQGIPLDGCKATTSITTRWKSSRETSVRETPIMIRYPLKVYIIIGDGARKNIALWFICLYILWCKLYCFMIL